MLLSSMIYDKLMLQEVVAGTLQIQDQCLIISHFLVALIDL